MTSTSNQGGYHVFLAALNCSVEEFTQALIAEGMKPERADQVARSIPCHIKKNVARNVAVDYGNAFQRAGAVVKIDSASATVEIGLPLEADAGTSLRPAGAELTPSAASALPMAAPTPASAAVAPPPEAVRLAPAAAGEGPLVLGSKEAPLDLLAGSESRAKMAISAAPAVAAGSAGVAELELDAPSSPMVELGDDDSVALDLGEPLGAAPQPLHNPAPAGLGADPGAERAPLSSGVGADEIALPPPEAVVGRASAEPGGFTAPGRKKVVLKTIPMPDPDPWIKRRYPHVIIGVILVGIASYLYGCTTIMASSVKLRRDIGDIHGLLENINAGDAVVSDDDVVAAVQKVGGKCGIDIARDDISISVERLGQVRLPGGLCQVRSMPDSFSKLSPMDQQMLMQELKNCSAPEWILSVQVSSKARWGLFSHTIDATVHTWLRAYEPK